MNPRIRYKLAEKILAKATEYKRFQKELHGLKPHELAYKHCSLLAEAMEWEANTLARLLALPSFKATDCPSVSAENKIIDFLGYTSYTDLEEEIMLEIIFEDFKAFYLSQLRR